VSGDARLFNRLARFSLLNSSRRRRPGLKVGQRTRKDAVGGFVDNRRYYAMGDATHPPLAFIFQSRSPQVV